MSIDPDDSVLEEALRNDLPSKDAQERMRRRLLAAGLAVGNGMAVTTSAAAGTATATTSLAAKLLGTSWGIKLGLAAAITIPSVGLILEAQSEPRSTVAAPSALPPPAVAKIAEPQPFAEVETEAPSPTPSSRRAKPASAPVEAAPKPVIDIAQPSQATFSAPVEAAPKPSSTLAEETRLLDGAFAALSVGDRPRASALVAEHEAKFPNGLLQKERQRAKAKLSEGLRGE